MNVSISIFTDFLIFFNISIGVSRAYTTLVTPKSFNNFEAREYDYDTLEKKLLGWYDEDVSEVEENKFDFIHPISNYASNNSRRFAI